MRTLQEYIGDLEEMVNNGTAPKHEVRSQIAFISREVAALEAEYCSLNTAYTKLQEAHSILEAKQAAQRDANWDALKKEADEQQKIIQSNMLNHDV
jgi:predicted nuclease with TOPRIM domain